MEDHPFRREIYQVDQDNFREGMRKLRESLGLMTEAINRSPREVRDERVARLTLRMAAKKIRKSTDGRTLYFTGSMATPRGAYLQGLHDAADLIDPGEVEDL